MQTHPHPAASRRGVGGAARDRLAERPDEGCPKAPGRQAGGKAPPPSKARQPSGSGRAISPRSAAADPSKRRRSRREAQPSQRVAALCAGGPEPTIGRRWSRAATKGLGECAGGASSHANAAKSPTGDRPKVGRMVRISSSKTQYFLCQHSHTILIAIVMIAKQMGIRMLIRKGMLIS